MNKLWLLLVLIPMLHACKNDGPKTDLPFLGNHQVVAGQPKYHTIRDFEYLNQDSQTVTNKSLAEGVYIADFFFTSCPSICPKVMKQMLRLYETFEDTPGVNLVSFTLDPARDDVSKLALYAKNLEVKAPKWHFLTGDKDFTLDLADDFFVAALEDPDAPGGFDHSGKIILVDKNGHVRSFCEGTEPETIPKFIEDVKSLLAKGGE